MNLNKKNLDVIGGPTKCLLLDVFEGQFMCTSKKLQPSVTFEVTRDYAIKPNESLKLAVRLPFCPTGIEYADGSGMRFDIGGEIVAFGIHIPARVSYDCRTRHGKITISKDNINYPGFISKLDEAFIHRLGFHQATYQTATA